MLSKLKGLRPSKIAVSIPKCRERASASRSILPSRRRFIPYSWLLYAEVNEAGTELYFHYSHSVVTITGTNLGGVA